MNYILPMNEIFDIFDKKITVMTIAEKFIYCDFYDTVEKVKKEFSSKNFDVIGIKKDGEIVGYIKFSDIKESKDKICGNHLKTFKIHEIIPESFPLIKTFKKFDSNNKEKIERLFILTSRGVTHIITKADFQKLSVRLYIFSLFTTLEMELTKFIKEKILENEIIEIIGKEKFKRVKRRLNNKREDNLDLSLVDELYFYEKYQIVLKTEVDNPFKDFDENDFEKLKTLRNNIAHSKDLLDKLPFDEFIKITIETYDFINKLKRNNS